MPTYVHTTHSQTHAWTFKRKHTHTHTHTLVIFHYLPIITDMGGINIKHKGNRIIIEDPEFSWQQIEVDKLHRWPHKPLSCIQPQPLVS